MSAWNVTAAENIGRKLNGLAMTLWTILVDCPYCWASPPTLDSAHSLPSPGPLGWSGGRLVNPHSLLRMSRITGSDSRSRDARAPTRIQNLIGVAG